MIIKKNNVLSRYAYHTIPLTLMGATFAVVSNSVLRMRDKDDLFNYFIGNHFYCFPSKVQGAHSNEKQGIFPFIL